MFCRQRIMHRRRKTPRAATRQRQKRCQIDRPPHFSCHCHAPVGFGKIAPPAFYRVQYEPDGSGICLDLQHHLAHDVAPLQLLMGLVGLFQGIDMINHRH